MNCTYGSISILNKGIEIYKSSTQRKLKEITIIGYFKTPLFSYIYKQKENMIWII